MWVGFVRLVLTEGSERIKKTISLRGDSSCLKPPGHQPFTLFGRVPSLPCFPFSSFPYPLLFCLGTARTNKTAHCCKNSFPGEICTTTMFFYGPSYKLKNDSTSVQPREPMSLLVCLHNRGEGLLTEARGRPKKLLHTAWMVTSPESHRWSHLAMRFLKPSLLPLRVPQGHMQLQLNCFSNGLGGLTDSPVRVQDPL